MKVVDRHLWERYRERSEEIRHTPKWGRHLIQRRKKRSNGCLRECKEKQWDFGFTRLKGLKKNQHNAWLIFACHNLKKMAIWEWDCIERNPDHLMVLAKF